MTARIAGVSFAIAAAILASACADEEILLATLPPGFDGGGGAVRCVDQAGCGPQELCARARCDDVGGVCELGPVVCPPEAMPVCGCDGITYWNDCLRKTAGVTAMTPGECMSSARRCGEGGPMGGPPIPGGFGRCPSGAFCARLLPPPPPDLPMPPQCPLDVMGTCWALPAVCPPPTDPDRWIACRPDSRTCKTTCDAIRSGEPHRRAKECF